MATDDFDVDRMPRVQYVFTVDAEDFTDDQGQLSWRPLVLLGHVRVWSGEGVHDREAALVEAHEHLLGRMAALMGGL